MKPNTLILALAILVALASSATATGSRLAGTWKSTAGNIIIIPHTPNDFELIVRHPDGSHRTFHAHWVKGMVGEQFWFSNENGQHVNCIYNRSTDRVRVTTAGAAGPGWWHRI